MADADYDALVHLMRQMAHDMRGPLGALTGTADMLAGGTYGELTDRQQRAAHRLQRSSYRALALLDAVMLFVKANARQIEPAADPFAPAELLRDMTETVTPEATARGLTLLISGDDSLPAQLLGDPALIRAIIMPLLWNAVLFSKTGNITIQVAWDAPAATWTTTVRDQGPGIKPDNILHIFKPLWRGDDRFQAPTGTSGFGMGLATAQAVAHLLGGLLTLVESGPAGSVFRCSLSGLRPADGASPVAAT